VECYVEGLGKKYLFLRVPAVTKQYTKSVCASFQELRDIVGCIKDAFLEGCPGRIELSCRIYRVSKEGFPLGESFGSCFSGSYPLICNS